MILGFWGSSIDDALLIYIMYAPVNGTILSAGMPTVNEQKASFVIPWRENPNRRKSVGVV